MKTTTPAVNTMNVENGHGNYNSENNATSNLYTGGIPQVSLPMKNTQQLENKRIRGGCTMHATYST